MFSGVKAPWFFVSDASKEFSSAARLLESTLARARVSVAFNRVRGLQKACAKWLLEKAGKKSGNLWREVDGIRIGV